MANIDRLRQYYDFDDDIIANIGDVAERQNKRSFAQLADEYGVANGARWTNPFNDDRAIDFMYLRPKQDYDVAKVRLYHTPMALPADQNMAMRAFRLFAVDSSVPLMVVGNPAAIGTRSQGLRKQDRHTIRHGDLSPAVAPVLKHMSNMAIEQADFIGYSYGADASATEAAGAKDYGIEANRGVWMEPTAVAVRSMQKLVKDFYESGKMLDAYVAAADSPPLLEARQLADTGLIRYAGGLLSASSRTIARGLTYPLFGRRAANALAKQPDLATTITWGDHSEISNGSYMSVISGGLQAIYGQDRVHSQVMRGMHHAGGDDIDLHAAMVLQSLRD